WIDGGQWELRFPTTVAPRFLGEPGRVPDAERVAVDVATGPLTAGLRVDLTVRDACQHITSPSHAVRAQSLDGATAVTLAHGDAPLDRDLVVRWAVAGVAPGASLVVAR